MNEVSVVICDLSRGAINVEFKVNYNVGLHTAHDRDKVCRWYDIAIWYTVHNYLTET